MEWAEQRRDRRRRIWLALSVLVSLSGFGALLALKHVEQDARRQELTAQLYATNIEQSSNLLRPLGLDIARSDPALLRKLVKRATAVFSSQLTDFRKIAPEETARIDRALDDLYAFADNANQTPEQIIAAIGAAASIAAIADEVAASQHERAERAEAIRTYGGMGVLALAVLLVGLLIHGDRKRTMAIERAHAAELAATAERDPLTGLRSRLAFSNDLAAREDAADPVEITLCDLNDFTELNHRLGHDAGDAMLMTVATDLVAAVGDDAVVYRTGGDQFSLLAAPGTGVPERVRALLEDGRERPLGSVGTACWPADDPSIRDVHRLADQRMYAVKRVLPRPELLTGDAHADAA